MIVLFRELEKEIIPCHLDEGYGIRSSMTDELMPRWARLTCTTLEDLSSARGRGYRNVHYAPDLVLPDVPVSEQISEAMRADELNGMIDSYHKWRATGIGPFLDMLGKAYDSHDDELLTAFYGLTGADSRELERAMAAGSDD